MNQISKRLSPAKVRLSDAAVLAGSVSLLYAAAVMIWPQAFPQLINRAFRGGYFYYALGALLVACDEALFVRIYRRRGQKPNWLTHGYIAFLTITLVFVFRALVLYADEQATIALFRHSRSFKGGISAQELLLYTHLGLVAGIFLPYLIVRLTQDYVSPDNSAEPEPPMARSAAAGQ